MVVRQLVLHGAHIGPVVAHRPFDALQPIGGLVVPGGQRRGRALFQVQVDQDVAVSTRPGHVLAGDAALHGCQLLFGLGVGGKAQHDGDTDVPGRKIQRLGQLLQLPGGRGLLQKQLE